MAARAAIEAIMTMLPPDFCFRICFTANWALKYVPIT
jgi:hypothetical protein